MRAYSFGKVRIVLASATFAALALLPLVAAHGQTPKYAVRNLGPLLQTAETDYAYAVSEDGARVVGQATVVVNRQTVRHAFYWDGAMHDIGIRNQGPRYVTSSGLVLLPYVDNVTSYGIWTLAAGTTAALPGPGGRTGWPNSMNDAGIVAGASYNPNVFLGYDGLGNPAYAPIGLRWQNSVAGWSYTQLSYLTQHNYSQALLTDSNGNILGYSGIKSVTATTDVHVVLWSPSDGNIAHDLGPEPASGTVIAFRTDPATLVTRFTFSTSGAERSWYSDGATVRELLATDTVGPYSAANGITSTGQVGGTGRFAGQLHAYYWDTTFPSGAVTDLGMLPGMTDSVVLRYAPMNNAAFIVGRSGTLAFLSTPASRATSAKLLDLNGLLTNTLSSVGLSSLSSGIAVNDAGFVLCNAVAAKGGNQRAALLTRVP